MRVESLAGKVEESTSSQRIFKRIKPGAIRPNTTAASAACSLLADDTGA